MSFNPYPKTERVKEKKEGGICPCGKEPISNQHYQLGASCMFELKRGITQKEHAKIEKAKSDERAKERQKAKSVTPSVTAKINKMSEKGAKKQKEIRAAKIKVMDAAKGNGVLGCVNCGSPDYQNSHIVPISVNMKLASDPNNISLLCGNCHFLWENGTIDKVIEMSNFLDDARYLHDNDYRRFSWLFAKVLDYEAATGDKFAASIIRKMEKFN
jgi:5-methylcytosine-specific restriction endonuclease McrA